MVWRTTCFGLREEELMLQHNGTDVIDRKILQELSSDARLPVAELGRRIKLSPSATAERVRRLEALELIRGYRADINLQALGFSITAFVRLTCDGNRYRPFLKFLPTLNAVQECYHLTGGDAFLLKVILSSVGTTGRPDREVTPLWESDNQHGALYATREKATIASRGWLEDRWLRCPMCEASLRRN